MALIKCSACGNEISASAATCPGCGHPVPISRSRANGVAIRLIFGLAVLMGAVWWFVGGGMNHEADHQMQNVKDKVASDAEQQYEIAARQGNKMSMCVQAGFAAAAYLQAQDETAYNQWKATEALDCQAAGGATLTHKKSLS